MQRTTRILLLLFLSSLLALALGWCWPGVQARPARAAPPTCDVDDEAGQRAAPLPAAVAAGKPRRSELPPVAVAPQPVALRPAVVRVRGQVLRSGKPVRGCDLSFQVDDPEAAPDEVEWDFTDSDGRYEVELPAARYVVTSEDAAPWRILLQVPADRRTVVVDFYLPP